MGKAFNLKSRVGQVWLYCDEIFVVIGPPFIELQTICHPVFDLIRGQLDDWYEYHSIANWEQNYSYLRVA
jgi:hypothetical protein